ncbi:MAG: DUF432 domain-containing protein [Methanophagales archaeon]|nr:DUF432 domain-containing protein [Methanophagales archaeon]
MYRYYDAPFKIVKDGISLTLEQEGERLLYRSVYADKRVEKILLADRGKVLINPIEPLNKPRELTSYLLIEFERTLVVEPGSTKSIFVTYPIEIGVFIAGSNQFELIDILTLAKQKFTLYGDPRSGVICKYWKSEVYSSIPAVNPLHEGIIELSITNTTTGWVEVTKAIFNAYGMKIYYNDNLVSMRATMKIMSGRSAETDFVDAPLEEGMKKSLELYTVRRLPVVAPKFVMEVGI